MENRILTKKGRKEYDAFLDRELTKLKGHHERCMLRCFNEFVRISNRSEEQKMKKMSDAVDKEFEE